MVSVERAGGMHRRLTHRCPTHQCLAPTWHQPGTNLVGDRERRSDGTASDIGTGDLLPRAWLKPGCTAVGARHRGQGTGVNSASDLSEFAGSDSELSAEEVERLAAEEPQDDLGLAAAGATAAVGGMVGSVAFVGSARAPRSLRRRRRLMPWLHHGVVHCALESQMGVFRKRCSAPFAATRSPVCVTIASAA